jgi:hypothetical protein
MIYHSKERKLKTRLKPSSDDGSLTIIDEEFDKK